MAVLSGGDWRRGLPDPEWRAYILRARERFLKGEAATTAEVRRLYRRVARQVRRDLEAVASGTLQQHHLRALERLLDRRARELNDQLLKAITAGIELSVREATRGAEQLALDVLSPVYEPPAVRRMFAAINERAVLALLSRTRGDGLRLSDRVWRVSERARNAVRRIVEDGVTRGQDARVLARQVQRYLQPGVRTALKPETRRRLRVPKDLSMEALRLAVTEVNTAFHEGTILAQRAIPSYLGVYWRLSASHPVPDVCDRYAANNGNGFWPKGEEPERPHPWCRCVVVPAHEDPDAFVQRLRAWLRDPQSQPDLEAWYTGVREFLPRPPLITGGSGGGRLLDLLIDQIISGQRLVTSTTIGFLRQEAAQAGFNTAPAERAGGRLAGLQWQGRIIRSHDLLPSDAAHYLRHVVVQQEWPPGTSLDEYVDDLRAVILDPGSGVFVNVYGGVFRQLGFVGRSRKQGPGGAPWTIVEYRAGFDHWVTGYQSTWNKIVQNPQRSALQWLKKPSGSP